MFSSLSTVKYKPWVHTLSTHTSHSFLRLSESAPIKGFCGKKLLCESYHRSPLMPLPMYSAVYTGNRHRSGRTETEDGLSISVSDGQLPNQETPTIFLSTDSPPSETSTFSFLTAIKSQKKKSS